MDIASTTGMFLDRNYTLKALRGMLGEMKDNPSRLKGKRVLFIHTGTAWKLLHAPFTTRDSKCLDCSLVQVDYSATSMDD